MRSTKIPDCIRMVQPMSYLETLAALQKARLVLTDSGGLQKEAFFCKRPCVVLRPETEWVEIVEAGGTLLADADESMILATAGKLIDSTVPVTKKFGNGHAAEIIVESILNH